MGDLKTVKRKNSTPAMPAVWSAFDLSEGFFLAYALSTIERLGMLESMTSPITPRKLAAKYCVDESILAATLEILSLRTNLIAYNAGKYAVTPRCDWGARFFFLQYVGSYGPNAHALARVLRDSSIGGQLVNREQHKRAFEQAAAWDHNPLAALINKLDLNRILDLGCGIGSMLLYLTSCRENFAGWGVDISSWMCAAARKRIAEAGMSRRIKILNGDSRNLSDVVPSRIVDKVQALTASGVANEFFSEGISHTVEWLTNIKTVFPGRTLLIADYYGQLGFRRESVWRGIVLHDYVSAISGQGIPPPNLAGWEKIYRASQCKLIHTIEEPNSPNFIHILQL